MKLNCIWLPGFMSKDLGNMDYSFIIITPRFIQNRTGSVCKGPIYESNRFIWTLLISYKYIGVMTLCKEIKTSWVK